MKPLIKSLPILFILSISFLLADQLPFTPEMLLSGIPSTANRSRYPSIAINNKGEAVIVWLVSITDSEEKGNIFVSTRDLFGIWSKPFQINSKTGGSANISFDRPPSLAINDNGEILVAWNTSTLEKGNIYVAFKDSQGNWSQEQQINNKTGGSANISNDPQVALNNSGEAIVCWYTHESSNYNIYAASRNSQGNWSQEQQINSKTQGSANTSAGPKVSMNDAGEVVVCWFTYFGSFDIYVTSRNPMGAWLPEQKVNSESTAFSFFPSLALNNNGKSVVCWESFDLSSGKNQISSVFRESNGVWLPEKQVSSNASFLLSYAQVAMNDSDKAAVTWYSAENNNRNVYTAFSDSQDNWSQQQQINNKIGGSANISYFPEISMNNKDEVVVCCSTSDPDNYNVYASSRCSQGNWSQEQQINSKTGGSANTSDYALVKINDHGETVICWYTRFSDEPNVYQAQTNSSQQKAETLYRFSKTTTNTHYFMNQ